MIHIYNTGNIFINQVREDEKESDLKEYAARKLANMIICNVYQKFDPAKAVRLYECWNYIKIAKHVETGQKKLIFATSCKVRLCPCCAWRRSRKYGIENSQMLTAINGNYIFLTVTVRNCDGKDLKKTLDELNTGWKRFYQRKKIKSVMLGSVRNVEITYNRRTKQFHPHMHIIMQVPASYYGKLYIKKSEYDRIWQESIRADYIPICDVRKVKGKKAVFEVSKYVAKLSDVLYLKGEELEKVIQTLDEALHKRRIMSYTGTFRTWRREQKLKDDIENEAIDYELSDEWEVMAYRWIYGENRYVEAEED